METNELFRRTHTRDECSLGDIRLSNSLNTVQRAAFDEMLATPCLLLDLDRMESNLSEMAAFFSGQSASLRAHTKTHKSPIIAQKQIELGSNGIACAKLGEAKIMVDAGIRDILITTQVIGESKLSRLAGMARHSDLNVVVDNVRNVDDLANAARHYGSRIGVLIELDVGLGRCGVASNGEALSIARHLAKKTHLTFQGLMGYEGHAVLCPSREERIALAHAAMEKLSETREHLEKAGFDCKIVSAGGTGTYDITGIYLGVTEIQAGSYVFMDGTYANVTKDFQLALTLLSTVISRPTKNRLILDVGMKGITYEFGYPTIKGYPDLYITSLSEEHAAVEAREGHGIEIEVGDKLELVPSHGDTTINLHDYYIGHRNGRVEVVWPIAARGKFR